MVGKLTRENICHIQLHDQWMRRWAWWNSHAIPALQNPPRLPWKPASLTPQPAPQYSYIPYHQQVHTYQPSGHESPPIPPLDTDASLLPINCHQRSLSQTLIERWKSAWLSARKQLRLAEWRSKIRNAQLTIRKGSIQVRPAAGQVDTISSLPWSCPGADPLACLIAWCGFASWWTWTLPRHGLWPWWELCPMGQVVHGLYLDLAATGHPLPVTICSPTTQLKLKESLRMQKACQKGPITETLTIPRNPAPQARDGEKWQPHPDQLRPDSPDLPNLSMVAYTAMLQVMLWAWLMFFIIFIIGIK